MDNPTKWMVKKNERGAFKAGY